MKTTIDLPEEVLHRAQEQAAQQGVNVDQFIAAAIAREVGAATPSRPPETPPPRRSTLPTLRGRGNGVIPSATPALQAEAQEEDDFASYRRSFGR